MHPWHDIQLDESQLDEKFPVVIEVPQGSKNKYEVDKRTGLLVLDRVLYSAVHYPANYGFVPRTYCDDGDALDVLVLGQEPVHPLVVVWARPIGVMRMRDDMGIDDKIIAVNARDPMYHEYNDHDELPAHVMRQMQRFFEDYKTLENKEVDVSAPLGVGEALKVVREAVALYKSEIEPTLARDRSG